MVIEERILIGQADLERLERLAGQLGMQPDELASSLAKSELLRITAPKPTRSVVTPMRRRADKSLERA